MRPFRISTNIALLSKAIYFNTQIAVKHERVKNNIFATSDVKREFKIFLQRFAH